jgi:hypothetical protein
MKYLLIVVFIVIEISHSSGQQTWKLAKKDQGIEVFVGAVPNSEYFAFKAIMSLKTTENEILKILKDVHKYPEWFAYTASTKLLKQLENEQYFLMETDYPWPFSNECMNYTMTFQRNENKSIKINIKGTKDEGNCKYWLKKASGYLLLEPNNEEIKITYYFHSEPSQNISTRLINPLIYRMPNQTFIALKKKLVP